MELICFNKDLNDEELLDKLAGWPYPVRFPAIEELDADFLLRAYEFPVVIITENGAICLLPRPQYEPQYPQFYFKRWSSVCRFAVKKC
jgi:hypothetical protein